jgi:hypothetical protein
LQPLVKEKPEGKCARQSKRIEEHAYESNEENEEGLETGERTLPLCFTSFKLLKQNVYNVSNEKSSSHDIESEERKEFANVNHLPLFFYSFEFLKRNHGTTEETLKSDYNNTALHEEIVVRKINNLHMH